MTTNQQNHSSFISVRVSVSETTQRLLSLALCCATPNDRNWIRFVNGALNLARLRGFWGSLGGWLREVKSRGVDDS